MQSKSLVHSPIVSQFLLKYQNLIGDWKTYSQIHKLNFQIFQLQGAEKLVRHLHTSNVPIALATSSSAESVQVKTTHHGELFKLFHHKVMGSSDPEVKEGKPAPDIFLIAARRFPDKPKPESCKYFKRKFNLIENV